MTKTGPKLFTIGVYGYEEEDFFGTLISKGIGGFCDIRQRRGLRGSQYAFANSKRLQERLAALGIHYVHIKALAPNKEIRQLQKSADLSSQTKKRQRSGLSDEFIEAYNEVILENFVPKSILEEFGLNYRALVFFCVEREPEACHRSLAAEYLGRKLDLEVEHIRI